MMKYEPPYINLYNSGKLEKLADKLYNKMKSCTLCPHKCGVDRTTGADGKCRSGILPAISSYSPHFGEESPLVGHSGSGTIFFTNCNLSCIFCQNYDISHMGAGKEVSYDELASIMIALQTRGCHNINFVTPTHMIYAIVKSLLIAIPNGLNVPLVYNSGGYDSADTIKLLDGVFNIYMPDFKYMDPDIADELSSAPDYPSIAMKALKEMYNQVGDLKINSNDIAEKGLLVRHLVLPNNIAATDRVINFLADLSKDTYVNIMVQYKPEFRAKECFDLKRRITLQEYDEAVDIAKKAGLHRLDSMMK